MKFINSILFFGTCIFLWYCTSQKKVNYEFPDAMLPHVKVHYAQQCDKGQILYDMNCGRCHSTRVGRRTYIPDFSPEQLSGYALRTTNKMHATNLPDSTVTEEELGLIMTFLSYKKKNIKN